MKQKNSPKGKNFEERVKEVLLKLRDEHPDVVRVFEQTRIELYDGQEVIPDFDLQFDLLFEESRYLIECQDRKRSAPQIAQKIKYVKGLSSRNRFIFVYASEIPETTKKALSADGVLHLSFKEFAAFIKQVDFQLDTQSFEKLLKDIFPKVEVKLLDRPTEKLSTEDVRKYLEELLEEMMRESTVDDYKRPCS